MNGTYATHRKHWARSVGVLTGYNSFLSFDARVQGDGYNDEEILINALNFPEIR